MKARCMDSGLGRKEGLRVSGMRNRAYLNPEEPTFLGFPIMISLYKSLKR